MSSLEYVPDSNQHIRVGGRYTQLQLLFPGQTAKQTIAFLDELRITAQTAIADAVAAQPLDAAYPVEIVTSGAVGAGTIVAVLTELYGQKVWQRLSGLAGAQDLKAVFDLISAQEVPLTITKTINPPINSIPSYVETYHGVKVVRIGDDEDVRVDTMLINKEVEFQYTNVTNWIGNSNTNVV